MVIYERCTDEHCPHCAALEQHDALWVALVQAARDFARAETFATGKALRNAAFAFVKVSSAKVKP